MKDEDLIDLYMAANQDEELDTRERWYTNPPEEFEPPVDPPGIPIDPMLESWMAIRFKMAQSLGRKQLDDIRKILDHIVSPLNPYIYRDYHYLGYYSTIGILIPNGFEVDQAETDKAWAGLKVTGKSFQMGILKNFKEGLHYKTKYTLEGVMNIKRAFWNKEMFYRRYVIIKSPFYSYPDVWIDDVVNALIDDLHYIGYRGNIRLPTMRQVELSYIDGFPSVPDHFFNFAYVINLGWFIGEIKMALKWAKEAQSAIPFPIMPNFGFLKTVPYELIAHNWTYIKTLINGYYGLENLPAPPNVIDKIGEFSEALYEGLPVDPSAPPPSTPPPSLPLSYDKYSDKIGE